MSQARRTSSRNSLLSEREGNKSNSNNAGQKRNVTVQKDLSVKKQNSSSSLKILGQDDEVSEESLYKGSLSDRSTPISSRSQSGILRPGSNTSRRTPTPSKQISLQAVRRKEESIEPLEAINWSELDQPFLAENDRIPALTLSDDESPLTLGSRPLSAEEQLAMIELRTKELTSALSSVHMDDNELDLSRQLEQIETAREDRERYEREKMIREERSRTAGTSENTLTVEDGQFTYRNEHFRDLSHRDPRDKIDKSFIMEGRGKTKDDMLKVGKSSDGQLLMDTTPETAVAIDAKTEIPEKTEAEIEEKKDEGATKDESTSSDDDSDDGDDDDDLIGEKGKAPNALLMEFLTCMMEEDYENAEKLCKMILIYEPENPEALSFYPLIQEKRQMEEAEEDDDDDDDSSDDSDDSGEEEDSDDDDDDDDEDDGDDDDDNNSSDSEVEPVPHTDSGIASANSD